MYFRNRTQTILLSKVILSLKLEGFSLKLRKLRKEMRKTAILSLKGPASITQKNKSKNVSYIYLQGVSVKEENVLID